MPDAPATTADAPPTTGLPQGQRTSNDGPAAPRTGDDLLTAAARGEKLSDPEQQDLLDYYLTNKGLPGDDEPIRVEWTIGTGSNKRKNVWKIRPISWEEWQDAQDRASNDKTGALDAYVAASYTVARALVDPKLGPKVAQLQEADKDSAPMDAAALLRQMFRQQSGTLISLHIEVLRISQLDSGNESARTLDKEVDAGKP